MKSITALSLALPLSVATLFAAEPQPHELTEDDRTRIESQVEQFLASYLEVIEAKDADGIRKLYVADERMAWFSDGEKRYTSADEVLTSLAGMEGMTFSTTSSDVTVLPLPPNLAHARSAFQSKISQGGAVVYEFNGVTTWLLEEVADGEWRVLTGHTSTPKPR